MLVRDRMSRHVITIESSQSLSDAHRLLVRHRIRQLPVTRDGHLVGIIAHRDLRGARPLTRSVASKMTAKPLTIGPDAAVDEAARQLRTYKIGGLPVVEQTRLLGIITVADVLDGLIILSGVSEATYRLLVTGRGGRGMEARARRVIERAQGEVRWLYRDARLQRRELHLRVKVTRIECVVEMLEAEGFEVLRVVPPQRGS